MKSNLLKFAAIAALCCGVFGACTPKEEETETKTPSLSATVTAVTLNSADLTITSENLDKFAVLAVEAESVTATPSAEEVYENGVKDSLEEDGTTDVTVENLEPETAYKIFVAACDADGVLFETVVSLDAVTPKDLTPTLTAEVTSVESFKVAVTLVSTNLSKYAYVAVLAESGETAPTGDFVFADGKSGALDPSGVTVVEIPGLLPSKDYLFFFAAADAEDNLYENVLTLRTTTADCEDEVNIYALGKNSVTLTVNLPSSIKEQNHVIKYGYMNMLMFKTYTENGPDAQLLDNGDVWEMFFNEESNTFSINSESSYIELDGELDMKYYAPIPGEPGVFMMGEFAYDETGDYEFNNFWAPGYHIALFDWEQYYADLWGGGDDPWDWELLSVPSGVEEDFSETKYWQGFYHRYFIQFDQPDPLDAEIKITENLKANGGIVTVEPSDNVVRCCAALVDDDTYQFVKEMYFDGNAGLFQWLVSSYYGMWTIGSFSFEGAVEFDLGDLVYANPGDKFHLLIAAHGDEEALTQAYVERELVIPDPSHPVPTVEAKSIPSNDSTYEISFNIKCTTGDAYTGTYACNYENPFTMSLNQYSDYGDEALTQMLVSLSGYNSFSDDEIAQINSAEGLDVTFSTMADAVSMFGVVLINDEGVPGNSVLLTVKSDKETVTRVESPLFESLLGDWTATATVRYSEYDYSSWTSVLKYEEQTSKVTFGDVTYPETLSDDVYQLYFDNTPFTTKEEVDAVYKVFKDYASEFNTKTRALNRILANGYNFYHLQYASSVSALIYKSAFDLFTDLNYSSAIAEAAVMDFGPKWYLEIAEDGTVTAPFSRSYLNPAVNYSYEKYVFGGYDPNENYAIYESYDENTKYGHFPVEISEDGNTITIKPYEYNGIVLYPNMLVDGGNSLYVTYPVVTEVVLTRGYTEAEPTPEAAPATRTPSLAPGHLTRTPMANVKPVKAAQKIDLKPVTIDEFKANVKKPFSELKSAQVSK